VIAETGIRYNVFAISISDTTIGKVKITPSSLVYNASLLYKLTQQQSVYATFNTGYRAPNVDDMGTVGIVDFRYEVPAPGLAPEKSRNIELGYKLQSNKWAATVSAYYMHLANLITRVKVEGEEINGYPVYKKENVEEGYIKGFETEVVYQLIESWNIKGNLAFTYGQSLTKQEPLRRIPPMNGRLISTYHHSKWFASAELLYASKQSRLAKGDKDDNRIPNGGTPGWTVCNLFGGYEAGKLKFNAGIQNLLNEDYRTHGSGINGVGRSAWLAMSVTL
jgi:outer membrane receptor protein involved in Fe transport